MASFLHHWHLEYHSVCQNAWPKQKGYVHQELELPPGKTARYDLCSCTDLQYRQVPRLGLTLCCHQLETTKNISFQLVFCKWSPRGQWKVFINSGDKPGLGVEQAVAKHQEIVIPRLQAGQRASGPPGEQAETRARAGGSSGGENSGRAAASSRRKGRYSTWSWYWDLP